MNKRQLLASDSAETHGMNFLSSDNRPIAIKDMYGECDGPPNVDQWNK